MFNVLLTHAIEDDDTSRIDKFPPILLNSWEKEAIEYIHDYKLQYGEHPPTTKLEDKFDQYTPLRAAHLNGMLEETINSRKQQFLDDLIINTHGATLEESIGLVTQTAELMNASPSSIMIMGKVSPSVYIADPIRFDAITPTLTKSIDNFMSGEMVTLYGDSGIGKSMIAANLAWQWALSGYKVLYISADMKPETAVARLHAIGTQQNSKDILNGDFPKVTIQAYNNLINSMSGEIYLPKANTTTPGAIRSMVIEHDIKAIVVDGAYFLSASGSWNGLSRGWENMSKVSGELKAIAHSLNVLMFAITQENTEGEIAFAKAFKQDSDIIIRLRRNEFFTDEDDRLMLMLDVLKHRRGPQPKVKCRLDFNSSLVYDEGR